MFYKSIHFLADLSHDPCFQFLQLRFYIFVKVEQIFGLHLLCHSGVTKIQVKEVTEFYYIRTYKNGQSTIISF